MEELRDKYQQGQLILIDKDLEWTSFDVVNKIRARLRYDLGLKKIKVGHAGTLDPLASGLLVVCTGKMTKQIDSYQAMIKEYSGTIHLGKTTPSYDAETEVDAHYPIDHISVELLEEKRNDFVGQVEQTVPIYSAVKIDGVRSYKLARQGEKVRTKTRTITISSFGLERTEVPEVDFSVVCSKGTYIRSLAHEFGKALDSGGYLTALRRTRIGDFDVSNALRIDDWVKQFQDEISKGE